MDKQTSSVEVKLNTHGKYTWNIEIAFPIGGDYRNVVKDIKNIDTKLRDEFPDHAKKTSGRVVDLDEYGS